MMSIKSTRPTDDSARGGGGVKTFTHLERLSTHSAQSTVDTWLVATTAPPSFVARRDGLNNVCMRVDEL